MKRITIADVAKHAGVSISTVSYALSNKRPIEEQTKQKIQQAIRDLGYYPQPECQAISKTKIKRAKYRFRASIAWFRIDWPGNEVHIWCGQGDQ